MRLIIWPGTVGISFFKWMGNKPVLFGSNFHRTEETVNEQIMMALK